MSNRAYDSVLSKTLDKETNAILVKKERIHRKQLITLYKSLFKECNNDSQIAKLFHKFNQILIDNIEQEKNADIIQTELGNKEECDKANINKVYFDIDTKIPGLDSLPGRDLESFRNQNTIKTCKMDNFVIKKPNRFKKKPSTLPKQIDLTK